MSSSPLLYSFLFQGKIVAQGKLLLQDTFLVTDQDAGLLPRCRERRVFLFEQIVIFSEPLDKKKGFSMPGFLFKNSIKVMCVSSFSCTRVRCYWYTIPFLCWLSDVGLVHIERTFSHM